MLSSIRTRLLLTILIIAVPLIGTSVAIFYRLAAVQIEDQKQTLVATTRALAAAVDAEIKKYAAIGFSLGASELLDSKDFYRFRTVALQALSKLPDAWAVVADEDGQQLLNTLRGYEDILPKVEPLDAHKRAMKTGLEQVGDAIIGPVAKRPAIGIFVPIVSAKGTSFDVVIGLDANVFAKILRAQNLPDGWVAGIGDRHRNFVARSIANDQFVGKPISAGWRAASNNSAEGYVQNISQEGQPLHSAFTNLSDSGWTISIGASVATLEAPFQQSMWLLGLTSCAMLLLSVILASLASRTIVRPMKALENGSEALLRKDRLIFKRTGLREVDITLAAFERASNAIINREEHHIILVNELNHRVKNTLAIVQAVALMAKKTAKNVSDYSASFSSRIVSLARTHDLLTEKSWDTIELREILLNEVNIFQNTDSSRIVMIGGVVELASKEAVSLGMIIHELATNAAKYGALSVDKGRLTISWMSDGPNTTKLDWIEEQGPAVRIPEKGNFGTKLIMQLAAGLSAEVKINFLETGLNFSMTIPTEPKSIDYLCR
ncbi:MULTISPECIES: sensor histidine kinase [unclassified Tardiphaga]|uniref:sensor histidine kinase n=1 Tax=unclassified Tardiphaga TaxID=2631404 RepID=UPI00143CD87D|nr:MULTISPECIES: sensor histidine kinase [unclassified Tardiphaga]